MLTILRRLNRTELALAAASLIFIVGQVWLDLKLPDYMSEITRLTQTPGSDMADIWSAGGKMLLCALGSLVCAIIVGFIAARVAASFARRLRSMLYNQVGDFSMREISQFSTSSLITRSTNDITQIQMFVTMGLQLIIKAPIMAVWAVIKIAGKGFEWTLATGVTVVFLMAVMGTLLVVVMPKFQRMQTLTDEINRVTTENLTGLRVTRAYNAESYQAERFEDVNDDLTRTQLFTTRGMAVINPTMSLGMNGLTLAIYWIGAYLINNAGATDRLTLFSNMVVFSSYAMQVVMSFMMLVMMFVLLPRAMVSARRINEVLDTQTTILGGTQTEGLAGRVGEIEFDHVSFKYPGAADYVLRDISFKATQGETVALIGSTGSGKSTIVSLLMRFYDPTEGQIRIDGVNLPDYQLEALYNKLGYVSQRAVLFKGTVASNIAYGDSGSGTPTQPELETAVRIAQSTDFVAAMPDQYDSPIAQGGMNVSGGQKQRLSIARAIARNPEILVFDDSFSALDYKTDRALRNALREETGGITNVIVAQRIGTIRDADQIIVLDEGHMVGHGTHHELLENCDVYSQIARSQLNETELAL